MVADDQCGLRSVRSSLLRVRRRRICENLRRNKEKQIFSLPPRPILGVLEPLFYRLTFQSISSSSGDDLHPIFEAYLITFGWAVVGSIAMAVGLVIAIKIFDLATTKINEWEEIGKGNMAVAVVIASVILSVGYVIGAAIGH